TLPANFYSSELLSSYVFLTIPGDYRFEALALDGSISGGFDLTIPQGGLPGVFNNADPAIHMSFPSQFQQGFLGSIYLMGDHFIEGAQLIVQVPNLPPVTVPLTYINSRTLSWTISAPLPGSISIQVVNPDLRTSSPITLTFQGSPTVNTGVFPRPTVAFGPSLLSAPFVGSSHIYGQDFLPGAIIEWKDLSSNQVTLTPAGYLSNQELLWTLVYPAPGQYELVVVNPDNQRSTPLTVDVQ
ncbi:MAG: hypothetical protein P1V97_30015, partial [Planctomycetota bacterium]|nr:hypothetical protein [Planctomycetota bacterium]